MARALVVGLLDQLSLTPLPLPTLILCLLPSPLRKACPALQRGYRNHVSLRCPGLEDSECTGTLAWGQDQGEGSEVSDAKLMRTLEVSVIMINNILMQYFKN